MRLPVKKIVNIKVPVRADIAGAFSDIAFYLDKYKVKKGEVTNIALPVMIDIEAKINQENANLLLSMPDLDKEIEGDYEELEKQEVNNVSEIMRHFIRLFDLDHSGLNISVSAKGKIPPASGLGTSSAVGVGVIMALSELYGLSGINPCELNYMVELAMGVMGGKQDYYAAWLGGANYLEFLGPRNCLAAARDHLDENDRRTKWFLKNAVVYYSGQSRSSGAANSEPEKIVAKKPKILNQIAAVAADSWQALIEMNDKKMAEAINSDRRNRLKLSKLYYTDLIWQMAGVAEKLGYAHRVCGAGSGGCALFFGNPKNHNKLESELKKIGGWKVC